MNPPPLTPRQQTSEMQQDQLKRFRSSSVTMSLQVEGGSVTESLPDEVWLMIFRCLSVDQLLIAEQVCVRWKAIVNTWFAIERTFEMWGLGKTDELQKMKRFGPKLKSLRLLYCDKNIDWVNEIADAFPNLLSLGLSHIPISIKGIEALTVKCPQLTKISLTCCNLTDEGAAMLFKAFPRLKFLELARNRGFLGKCFRELGSNLEELILVGRRTTTNGILRIFSRCKNLKTIDFDNGLERIGAYNFSQFCKIVPLQSLTINYSRMSSEELLPISHLALLEQLRIHNCEQVNSDVLIAISLGCPNLKKVTLSYLPLVCDRGVSAFTKCKLLISYNCFFIQLTETSLFEIAKCGALETLHIYGSEISDRGLSAIVAQCPRLKYLDLSNCIGIGNGTVDAVIQAVERRQSATDKPCSRANNCRTVPGCSINYDASTFTISLYAR